MSHPLKFDPVTFALDMGFNGEYDSEFNPDFNAAELGKDFEEEFNEEEIDDEPRHPYDEDKLIYWGRLEQEGWTTEEMLSQGMIDIATYPFFDDEEKEPIPLIEITDEELMSYEPIYF